MNRILLDARYALRHFTRRPGVTATMVAVLVIGMTIATSLFSFVHAYLVEPPRGIARADDLVRIRAVQSTPYGLRERRFERVELDAHLSATNLYRSAAGWTTSLVAVEHAGSADPDWVTTMFVTDAYFDVLGVHPAAGPGLPAMREGDTTLAAVVSRALRERHFASDAEAIGRTLVVAGRPVTIVGIAPAQFRGVDNGYPYVLWLPDAASETLAPSIEPPQWAAVARLAPGTTATAASAAAAAITTNAIASVGDDPRVTPSSDVVPLAAMNGDPLFEQEIVGMTTALSLLALVVLLVTGTNASALQTGLSMARGREIAMRFSLGASRGVVVRQLLTESGLLGLVAGAATLALLLAVQRVGATFLSEFPVPVRIDAASIAFTFGIALAAGVIGGISPALHASRAGVAATLKATTGGSSSRRGGLQRGLVVAQVLLTMPLVVLLTAMVLMVVAEYRREAVRDVSHEVALLELRAASSDAGAVDPAREVGHLAPRLENLPMVERAIPNVGRVEHYNDYVAEGATDTTTERLELEASVVAPGWFETMDRPIRAGRALALADSTTREARDDAPIVIGEDLAAAIAPGRTPIGMRILPPPESTGPALVVVGVARTPPGMQRRPGDEYEVFTPATPKHAVTDVSLLVRLRGDPLASMRELRDALRATAPGLGIVELRTLAQIEEEGRNAYLVGTAVLAGLGFLALFLSAIGLYAVVAFAVTQRTAEIAVRLAVGARTGQVVRHTMRDGMRLTAVGLVVGVPLSLAALHVVISTPKMLPPVPLWQVAAIAVLGVVAIATAATWIPARRAARVAPASVLRSD